MGRYVSGERVIVDFTFDEGDPTAVTARLHKPDGVEDDLLVTPEAGDGAFRTSYLVLDDDPPGDYLVKIEGTGVVVGAKLHRFYVEDDGFV